VTLSTIALTHKVISLSDKDFGNDYKIDDKKNQQQQTNKNNRLGEILNC
jgi:hypothetical protein